MEVDINYFQGSEKDNQSNEIQKLVDLSKIGTVLTLFLDP
jgi:hypothetical protein